MGDGAHVSKKRLSQGKTDERLSLRKDPIDQLYVFWTTHTIPPLAWAIEWSRGGQVDPVNAIWAASLKPGMMINLVFYWLREQNDTPDGRADLIHLVASVFEVGRFVWNDEGTFPDQVIRAMLIGESPKLRDRESALEAAIRLYSDSLRAGAALSIREPLIGGEKHPIGAAMWAVDHVAQAIGLAGPAGHAEDLEAHRIVSDVIRAHVPAPTYAEFLAWIERPHR